ncbi:hypothetical protein HYDPIDRAFT_115774 [Hydnomerulius pinastri MD-312]|uniref:Uncharacterized protein n=1 Tax=Hydnomerulius pinastri MD-312 TaxID=994086 RepID=A0A0C9WBZ0_9AGAM|nr:hypothetical protein HYDPIDRAFT_115774 [Hydnomerulius pinastri MD-312]
MNASSSSSSSYFTNSRSSTTNTPTATAMDIDVTMMDATQDVEEDVVRWVASQSPNPALQALMKEAERERKIRPTTPIFVEPFSWTTSIASTSSSGSTSTSSASLDSGINATRTSSLSSISSGTKSAASSSSAFHTRGSDPSTTRRSKFASYAQRKPLSASTSSANQAVRPSVSARPRSSSHSANAASTTTSKAKSKSPEEQPEAVAFLALLRDVSRQVDENAKKKQRLAARAKERERERSHFLAGIDSHDYAGVNTDTACSSASRVLIKTSSASAISRSSASNHGQASGRVLTKTASLGASGVSAGVVSGRSPAVASSAPAPRVLTKTSSTSTITKNNPRLPQETNTLELSSDDDERGNAMKGIVVDLNDTDTEWEKDVNLSRAMCVDSTATFMHLDDDDDMGLDVSFFQPALPQPLTQKPKPAPAPAPAPAPPTTQRPYSTTQRPPGASQRPRAGPPPLGMRRAPQLQSTQYSPSQAPKGVIVPRFKPPLLANGRGAVAGGGTRQTAGATSYTLKANSRSRVMGEEEDIRGTQDPDSSFDVSFGVDVDALEEAMKAYD